ncbi:MAG: IS607 family transposase, partial [Clostridia bacterium]|nr:IS607 family transposase [Clostridia bacterium]
MKANEVLNLLRITRPTLTKYVKEGIIKVDKLPNGRYEYDSNSVYSFLNKDVKRKTYIYARVSTSKQKADLDNQIKLLKQFCFTNGYVISGIYSDIASGIRFEKRKNYFKMLDDIIDNKVEKVVITYKDRLSRVGFDLFYHLFKKYNCEIIVMSEVGSEKLDSEEIFEEMVSLLHCYSMKLYSKRKVAKIKEVLSDNDNNP